MYENDNLLTRGISLVVFQRLLILNAILTFSYIVGNVFYATNILALEGQEHREFVVEKAFIGMGISTIVIMALLFLAFQYKKRLKKENNS